MPTALRGHVEMLPEHGHSEQCSWHPNGSLGTQFSAPLPNARANER